MLLALIVGTWLMLTTVEVSDGVALVIVSLATVCELLTIQDVPDPEMILVPGMIRPVGSDIVCPMASAPDATAETVSAVPAIDPVNTAPGLLLDPTRIEMMFAHVPSAATGA
jgi:hypothetical protein